ncbi:MAG TPA: Asp-tRNA(Asn)/Glu-tRNA(Gln) amidotransferase subunit GatB [Candidatus Paceibacterota bacterium]|nr:Asp-tRNA(Asn)/Glu-tRNA(Gln) amidotransferase subunit GatB [Candidatus Paceibacterota bacterium]
MNTEYKVTVGLEVHAELKTKTKMFCRSFNDPEEKRPNVNVCPVCMGHPGTLPVINKEAVKHVLKVGKALGGTLADFTEFDRKNYFYPDIPKGYQISQYQYPLVSGGSLEGVEITRVHLEEDTGTSLHDQGDFSLVNYNRAGVPLMELVTEPVVKDAEHAVRFGRELQLLLRTLGVSEANMEKGQMRVEANISVSKTDAFGTKVEVKNLNSFRAVERAILYETQRQIGVLEEGGEVVQETRGWNENKNETFSQRSKENANDYRYFPDPDLPKLKISEVSEFQNLELPELPWEKRARYREDFGLKDEDVEVYLRNPSYADFFEETISTFSGDAEKTKLASNYLTSDVAGLAKNMPDISPFQNLQAASFAELIEMAKTGDVSSRGAKDILKIMFLEGGNAAKIAEEKNLLQQSDEGELLKIVEQVIAENASVAEEYRGGKETSLKYLVGQGMKATTGSANPQTLEKLLKKVLDR